MHAAQLDDPASIPCRAGSSRIDPRPERIKAKNLLQDDLIRPEVPFPRPVRMLEVDLPAHGGERHLPERLSVTTRPQVLDHAPDVLQRHVPLGAQLGHDKE